MPWTDIAILCEILGAFVTFGLVLAYGQYQTRGIDGVRDDSPAVEPSVEDKRKLAA